MRRKAVLECDHEVWFDPAPHDGDTVYCKQCMKYVIVGGGAFVNNGIVYHADYEWESIPEKSGYRGRCAIDKCQYNIKRGTWGAIRQDMEMHHLRAHTNSTLINHAERVPIPKRLPRNSPPPF